MILYSLDKVSTCIFKKSLFLSYLIHAHKNPLPLYYIVLEPDIHNQNILNVTGLL